MAKECKFNSVLHAADVAEGKGVGRSPKQSSHMARPGRIESIRQGQFESGFTKLGGKLNSLSDCYAV